MFINKPLKRANQQRARGDTASTKAFPALELSL